MGSRSATRRHFAERLGKSAGLGGVWERCGRVGRAGQHGKLNLPTSAPSDGDKALLLCGRGGRAPGCRGCHDRCRRGRVCAPASGGGVLVHGHPHRARPGSAFVHLQDARHYKDQATFVERDGSDFRATDLPLVVSLFGHLFHDEHRAPPTRRAASMRASSRLRASPVAYAQAPTMCRRSSSRQGVVVRVSRCRATYASRTSCDAAAGPRRSLKRARRIINRNGESSGASTRLFKNARREAPSLRSRMPHKADRQHSSPSCLITTVKWLSRELSSYPIRHARPVERFGIRGTIPLSRDANL